MSMKGAILGDIIGSQFESVPIKSKEFKLYSKNCKCTDASIMTVAITQALLNYKQDHEINLCRELIKNVKIIGRKYKYADFDPNLRDWITSNRLEPYGAYDNEAPMRCSAAGWLASSEEEAVYLGKASSAITHNHPLALKACGLMAQLIYQASHGASMEHLKETVGNKYPLISLEILKEKYEYDHYCQGTMPVALEAFFESEDFEDAIRNAISIGGDVCTIASITGALAEAYYGVPKKLAYDARKYINTDFIPVYDLIIRREKNGHVYYQK